MVVVVSRWSLLEVVVNSGFACMFGNFLIMSAQIVFKAIIQKRLLKVHVM